MNLFIATFAATLGLVPAFVVAIIALYGVVQVITALLKTGMPLGERIFELIFSLVVITFCVYGMHYYLQLLKYLIMD